MQDLQDYGTSDDSQSSSEPSAKDGAQGGALPVPSVYTVTPGVAGSLQASKRQAVLASSTELAATAKLPVEKSKALPAPSALLDLPLDALVVVPPPVHDHISAKLANIKKALPELQVIAAHKSKLQYHLSLSHTVPIRYHQIQPLLASLKTMLHSQQSFQVALCGWKIYQNVDKSRTFLAVPATKGLQQMNQAIQSVNQSFTSQGLPTFYEKPDPHISVAWILGDSRAHLEQAIHMHPFAEQGWQQTVRAIACMIGQRVTDVWSDS